MTRRIHQPIVIAFSVIFLIISAQKSFADDIFDLSYSLTEGGNRLELNPANPYKGVKIEINSNIATQYEVISDIIKPLENKDHPEIAIRDNFVVRGLTGTNRYGNLRIPANDTSVASNESLYVSNTTGNQDSFTLVYGITRIEDIAPGNYFARVSFTLRPIGSNTQPVTKILEVYVNITEEITKASVEITPISSLRTIKLDSAKKENQKADVSVAIKGVFKNHFQIGQVLTKPLESNEGKQLTLDAIKIVLEGLATGTAMVNQTPLSLQPQAIYASGANGEKEDNFIISYSLSDDAAKERAGRYASRIQYLIDEDGKVQKLLGALELEVEIARIFSLLVTPENYGGTINFTNLKPNNPPQKNEVTIEIISNTYKQYQVNQNVDSELTNKEGDVIPNKYFTLKTEGNDIKGNLRVPQNNEVKKGETILFVSDNQGSSDKFKIIYELTCPRDVRAGDYSTRIVYSILEI